MKRYFINLKTFLNLFLIIFVNVSLKAQEYPTDRIFMKHFKKTNCLREIEERVNSLKSRREMTLEHEVLLNNTIWNKVRTNLPLTPGEMKRFLKLRKNGPKSNKLISKKLWKKKEKEFKLLRSKCKL